MTQQKQQTIETMTQNLPEPECASTEAATGEACTHMQPCADLEPTTKSVPRKSDAPIERSSKNDPQTSTQDANKP